MDKEFKKVLIETPISKLKNLDIKCTSTKCEDGLHCFNMTKKAIKNFGKDGLCRDCGKQLIDWKRFQKNDITDIKFLVKSLDIELIRHAFWHSPIEEKAIQLAQKRGIRLLRQMVHRRIKNSIGNRQNYREGKQTTIGGSEIIHYGQHATGTCCRKCLEYWHNIKMGTDLTEKQLEFCTELVMYYIEKRVPHLTDEGATKNRANE